MLLGGIGDLRRHRASAARSTPRRSSKQLWGLPPALDMDYEKRVQTPCARFVAEGLAESAHDLSDGGLAVALAECSFGPDEIGAQIELDSDLRPELLAFHEAPSRILISTAQPEARGGHRREVTEWRRRWWALQLRRGSRSGSAPSRWAPGKSPL